MSNTVSTGSLGCEAVSTAVVEDTPPGTRVGAGRWPYVASHPDAWLKPWTGVVLRQDDPRAWTGTIAFSGRPTRTQVRAHLEDLIQRGYGIEEIPVLWDFESEQAVRWESRHKLVPAAQDLADWGASRKAALQVEAMRRHASSARATSAREMAPA